DAWRDTGNDVTIINKSERSFANLMIETVREYEIASAWLAKGVEPVDGRVAFEYESRHGHAGQCCAKAVSFEPERLPFILKLFNGGIHFIPHVTQAQIEAGVNKACGKWPQHNIAVGHPIPDFV